MDDRGSSMDEAVTKTNVDQIAHPLKQNKDTPLDCDAAEEVTTDSEEYLAEPLRYRNFQYSTSSNQSASTMVALQCDNILEQDDDTSLNGIQIPIVGYEIMEERARFTVYKLRIENRATGDCWYVFRRYTDFVRLCNKIKNSHPQIVQFLPRKRWLRNNFDPLFLDERVNGLQVLVNTILAEPSLIASAEIQDFFCLNEPPMYSDTNEESRVQAMFEALDETINDLKMQLREKDSIIDSLQDSLHLKTVENENFLKVIKSSLSNCQKCQKEYENLSKLIK